MKKRIWKYPLLINSYQVYKMPKGTEILSLQMQDGKPCIWALVSIPQNAKLETEFRYFRTLGTGQQLDDHFTGPYKFIGTYQDDPFVWHVFETKD